MPLVSSNKKEVCATSIFSSPLKNSIARVVSRESTAYFNKYDWVDFGGTKKECALYHPIENAFSVDLTLEEALSLVSVTKIGDDDATVAYTVSWVECDKRGSRSDALKKKFRGVVPGHISLRFNNSRVRNTLKDNSKAGKIVPLPDLRGKGSGKGKKSDHKYIAYIDGWCKHKENGCKTTFIAGFEYSSLMAIVRNVGPVQLQITFFGSCCHPKSSSGVGQVRGSDRQQIIDDINNPKIANVAPKQMVKDGLMQMSSAAHHAQNYDGIVATSTTAYNISREAKEALMKKYGFTKCKLTNLVRARSKIMSDDLAMRQKLGDTTQDCAGLFRGFSLDDEPVLGADTRPQVGLRLNLFNKTGVIIMHEFCRTGKAVLNYDGTGWMGSPIVELPKDQIVLHHILSIQPLNALVLSSDFDIASRLVQPKIIAEYISNRGAAPDHSRKFLDLLLREEKNICGYVHPPLLLSVDCAGQLQSAFLESYARAAGPGSNLIQSRTKYHNVLCIVLLRYEHEVFSPNRSSESIEVAARSAVDRIRKNFALLIHECKCHIYRAVSEWVASTDRPSDFRNHQDSFKTILLHLVLGACDKWHLSESIARFAVAMSIFRSKTIPVPSFDFDSPTSNHHNSGEAMTAASAMAAFMSKEAERHRVASDDSMEEQVKAAIDSPSTKDKFCVVDSYCNPSIEQAVSDGLVTSQVYLKSVDKAKKKGLLSIAFYYGVEFNDEGGAVPLMVGGFEAEVDLPFTECAIANPLYSKATDDYLSKKVANKLGLFSYSALGCVDKSHKTKVAKSNSGSEGLIRWEKENDNLKRHKSDIGLYIMYRWTEHIETDRLFINQLQAVTPRLIERKKRAEAKSKSNEYSEEARQEEEEYYSDVKWCRDNWTLYDAKLKDGLHRAFKVNNVGEANATEQHRVLSSHGLSIGFSFTAYPTYNAWITGKRKSKKPLHANSIKVIESYIVAVDRAGKTNV